MADSHETFARIVDLDVPRSFISNKDNHLVARISFENPSDLKHSAQVVFRGYIREAAQQQEEQTSNRRSKKGAKEEEKHEKPRDTRPKDHFVDFQLKPREKDDKEKEEEIKEKDDKNKKKKDSRKQREQPRKETAAGVPILYEFLHEQIWLVLEKRGRSREEVRLDVWLPRFPPSGPIHKNGPVVEYTCRVTIDPWHANRHVERVFEVLRTLTLKRPHVAEYSHRIDVHRCVDHSSGILHKKCRPINGEIWTDKAAFVPGESITVRYKLGSEAGQRISDAQITLIRTARFRLPDPSTPQQMVEHIDTVATTRDNKKSDSTKKSTKKGEKTDKEEKESSSTEKNVARLKFPDDCSVTVPMTIYNVLTIEYEVQLQVSVEGHKKPVYFRLPVIVTTARIEAREGKQPKANASGKLYRRAVDIDDDSDDDDDIDSDFDDSPDKEALARREFSMEVENVTVATRESGQLYDAYAEILLLVNSRIPRALHSLRLLFTGECRAGSTWYEFLRYKAIVTNNSETALSPGEHIIKIALPFADSQYDTNILAPSLDDDIRYQVRVTLEPWSARAPQHARDVFVDRFVDTWAKADFDSPWEERRGPWRVRMRQRCFARGKFAFAQVDGEDLRGVRLELVQQRRLRKPMLRHDDSLLFERVISEYQTPKDGQTWPPELYVPIPPYIQPSLEISYWNVLVLGYSLVIYPRGKDGHEHRHAVPIWIGCTDDKLGPPLEPIPLEGAVKKEEENEPSRAPSYGSLPSFEVWRPDEEELQVQPWWVERYNHDTYQI